jgi:hypothetical protein
VRKALDDAWSSATRMGCRPLIWPAGKLLLEAFGADLTQERRTEITTVTHDAVAAIRAGLPDSIGTPWAASTGLATPSDVL